MEYHDLEKTTVSRLRELLKEHDPERKGVSGMKKDELVAAVARALGLGGPRRAATGLDKAALKAELRAAKARRDAAIQAGDRAQLKEVRRQLHRLRRGLRKAAPPAAE